MEVRTGGHGTVIMVTGTVITMVTDMDTVMAHGHGMVMDMDGQGHGGHWWHGR